jgi:hypothetical protein
VDRQLARLGADFSALHARFLEGNCKGFYHRFRGGLEPKVCDLKPQYVEDEMRKIGHQGQRFVVFSDRQRMDLVRPVMRRMNGTRSANASPFLDELVMIHSARFLGNSISTMSYNVELVRITLFPGQATALL